MTDNRMRNIMIFRCGVCYKATTQTGPAGVELLVTY